MRERVVVPEILDSLPVDDPAAIRSRRDLRVVDWFMRNGCWVRSCLSKLPRDAPVHELGAGDGVLLEKLAGDGFSPCGYDLAPRPQGLSGEVDWRQGDLLADGNPFAGAVVATLFLHHFEADALAQLGRRLRTADLLAFAEPLRTRLALTEGYALVPFVGKVTRHDMIVSIRAGFVPGELPLLLGLDDTWEVSESATLTGGYRMWAKRR